MEVAREDARESKGPARGYKWADATAGNTLAVRHGAGSDRLVSERATTILADLADSYPWLVDADAIVLDVLVKAKIRMDALDGYITAIIEGSAKAYPRKGQPETGIEAVPDKVWQQVSRESRTVVDAAAKLGLTATDRAQLLKDTGLARHFGGDRIAALAEQGRSLRLAKGDA
ncbi:MAG: hypothetical protein M0004_12675 [Actinomycetota bacterium]|nr:hypothetical protein [Actinomycetota bacterium]